MRTLLLRHGFRSKSVAEQIDRIVTILGIRRGYGFELASAVAALAVYVSFTYAGMETIGIMLGYVIFMMPILFQYNRRLHAIRVLGRMYAPEIQLPLANVFIAAVMSVLNLAFLPLIIISILYLEDITLLLALPGRARETVSFVKVVVLPLKFMETAILVIVTAVPAVAAVLMTGDTTVLLSPAAAYALLLYSMLAFAPRRRSEERGRGIEALAHMVPFLHFIYVRLYSGESMKKKAREAGMTIMAFDLLLRKASGAFVLAVYAALTLYPIIYETAPHLLPLLALPAAATLAVPYIIISIKRSARASNINRNLILILVYIAAMKSVLESFTNMMRIALEKREIANIFNIKNEAKLYLSYKDVYTDEYVAMMHYSDSVPSPFYRDVLKSYVDYEQHEGPIKVFEMLVERLEDYTRRFVSRVENFFTNVAMSVITVVLLQQSLMPLFASLSNPANLPSMIVMVSIMSLAATYAITSISLPRMKSDLIRFKARLRRYIWVAPLFSSLFTVVVHMLFTDDVVARFAAALSVPMGIHLLFYVAASEDLRINRLMLEKAPELYSYFSIFMTQTQSVEQSIKMMLETTLPSDVKRELRGILQQYQAAGGAHGITFRGPYWAKVFRFIVYISAFYGVAPRKLFEAMTRFTRELSLFFSKVRGYAVNLLIVLVMGQLLQVIIIGSLLGMGIVASSVMGQSAGQLNIELPLRPLTLEEANRIAEVSIAALMATAYATGVLVARLTSGTYLDPRWGILLVAVQLLFVYGLAYYNWLGLTLPIKGANIPFLAG